MDGEEFEFKPITQGLGFHKKVLDLRDDTAATRPTPKAAPIPTPTSLPTPSPLTPPSTPQVSWTLPQHRFNPMPTARPLTQPAVPIAAPTAQSAVISAPTNWGASLFDGAMVAGLSLIFSAIVFALTNVDITTFGSMLTQDPGAFWACGLLIMAASLLYSVICRSFFGRTLGEWAFEGQCGTSDQQAQLTYPIKIAWRTLLTAVTGFLLLPLLSMLLGRDIAGMLSGVKLARRSD